MCGDVTDEGVPSLLQMRDLGSDRAVRAVSASFAAIARWASRRSRMPTVGSLICCARSPMVRVVPRWWAMSASGSIASAGRFGAAVSAETTWSTSVVSPADGSMSMSSRSVAVMTVTLECFPLVRFT